MTIRHRFACAALLGLAVAATGCAPTFYGPQYPGAYESPRFDRRAYDKGYEEGLENGRDDARHRRPFDYARHGDFRHADEGYERAAGPREEYRDQFRRGFVTGYREAYRANARY